MPDKKAVLQCRLADQSAATAYRESCLDDEDRARLLHAPKLAGRTDWQVSRFLKQQGGKVRSLSHSNGYAAVLVCDGDMVCGVDIEIPALWEAGVGRRWDVTGRKYSYPILHLRQSLRSQYIFLS